MTDTERDTIKKYLTINAVLDQCLLSGLEESNIDSTEPLRIVSINNVPLKNEIKGICTIGFIKKQVERKQQLEDQLKKLIEV
jgi:hypothetical protein